MTRLSFYQNLELFYVKINRVSSLMFSVLSCVILLNLLIFN